MSRRTEPEYPLPLFFIFSFLERTFTLSLKGRISFFFPQCLYLQYIEAARPWNITIAVERDGERISSCFVV